MLIVIVPFVAFFFLKEGHRITHGLIELVPNRYFEMTLNLMHSINNSIGGYIRGQLLAVSQANDRWQAQAQAQAWQTGQRVQAHWPREAMTVLQETEGR